MPVVRWTTTVIESAVSVPVLASLTSSSLKNGPLELTTGEMVTPPFPPLAVGVGVGVGVRDGVGVGVGVCVGVGVGVGAVALMVGVGEGLLPILPTPAPACTMLGTLAVGSSV